MRTLWNAIARTVFWSYDRGTWPYDVMVGAIIIFVLATPRTWFNDQARVGPAPHPGEVVVQEQDTASGAKAYRVDFHLLVNPPRSIELERRAHELLQKNVEELRGKTFKIDRIEPVLGDDGTVLAYDIWVRP